jgi:hypothetical protein
MVTSMDQLNLIEEVFRVDTRPTIITDVVDTTTGRYVVQASSCNNALLTDVALCYKLFHQDQASGGFMKWILAAENIHGTGNISNQDSYSFCGLKWIKFTIFDRWRIVSTTSVLQQLPKVPDISLINESQNGDSLQWKKTGAAMVMSGVSKP